MNQEERETQARYRRMVENPNRPPVSTKRELKTKIIMNNAKKVCEDQGE